MPAPILERIRASTNLPSMPLAAFKVLELSQREDVTAAAIAEVIQTDPALTVKVLKMANSPLFGLAKKVSSVQQATVLLGMRAVKVMALSFSLVDRFRQTRSDGFDYKRYWRRSLTSAVASKLIAGELGTLRADEGLVGGLLSDVGMLAADRYATELYAPVLQRLSETRQPLQTIEQELLGITHARISSELLAQWSLPEFLCNAVAAHHGEGLDALKDRTRLMATVLYAGASIAELFCGDVSGAELEAVESRCLGLVPLTPQALRRIMDALHTHVQEMASLFNVQIDEAISYEDLRNQAMTQLATLSFSAEMDRAEATGRAARAQVALEQISSIASAFEREASTDALTQIANRKAFDARLAETLSQAQRGSASVGLILLDLDHFKMLNDTFGHQVGDEVLRRVGHCLKSACASVALAARYGGEEFGVILTQATARAMQELAEDIRRGIERIEFQHADRPVRLTASLGAAHVSFAHESVSAQEMIHRADRCLYEAKRNGRNCVEISAQAEPAPSHPARLASRRACDYL